MYSMNVDSLAGRVGELVRIKEERGRSVGIWHVNLTSMMRAFRTGSYGEAVFERWLEESGFLYSDDQDTGNYEQWDYLVNSSVIDVKTRASPAPYSDDYVFFAKANSLKVDIDYLVFCWYQWSERNAVLAGWLPRDDVLQCARYYSKGEKIKKDWSVPCDAYVIPGCRLRPMDELAVELREYVSGEGLGEVMT